MPKFHFLKIKEVRRETDECVSVAFEVPKGLKPEYRFIQGQHLTLKTKLDGEEIRRSYSICASPFDDTLRVAIKKLEGGRFSTFANEKLRAGDIPMAPGGSGPDDSEEEPAEDIGEGQES